MDLDPVSALAHIGTYLSSARLLQPIVSNSCLFLLDEIDCNARYEIYTCMGDNKLAELADLEINIRRTSSNLYAPHARVRLAERQELVRLWLEEAFTRCPNISKLTIFGIHDPSDFDKVTFFPANLEHLTCSMEEPRALKAKLTPLKSAQFQSWCPKLYIKLHSCRNINYNFLSFS